MIEKRQKYLLAKEKISQLIKEFDCPQTTVSRALNCQRSGTLTRLIVKRAKELGAKLVTITTITEEVKQ